MTHPDQELAENIDRYLSTTLSFFTGIGNDVLDGMERGFDRITDSIDQAVNHPDMRDLGEKFHTFSTQGTAQAKQRLSDAYQRYDTKLNQLVGTHPRAVGLWDGLLHINLGVTPNRLPKSQEYRTSVAYGQALGVGTAVYGAMSRTAIGTLAAMSPLISRAVPYLNKKLQEAKQANPAPA